MTRRWHVRDHLPSVVVCVLGLGLSVAVSAWERGRVRAEAQRVITRRAQNMAASLRVSQTMWLELVRQLEAFYQSSDDVTRADFRDFVSPALARFPEVAALEWSPLVRGPERAAFEAKVRREGLPAYRIREPLASGTMVQAGDRHEYLPLLYLEPMSDTAMGLDVYANAAQRAAPERARDTGEPAVSGRFRLVEDPEGVYAVVVHVPVYRRGAPVGTVEERRAAMVGMIEEVLRLGATLERTLAGFDLRGTSLVLEDDSAHGDERALYRTPIPPSSDAVRAREALPFAGRLWAVELAAEPEALVEGRLPGTLLVLGVAGSLLLGVLLSTVRMIRRLRREVLSARSVGQYQLQEKLGEGGMGAVYKARHSMLRRPTAVKVLVPGRTSKAELKRFEREVQITGRLTHPNTIVVYDYGHTPDGRFYYAMEYLDGINLEYLVLNFGAQPAGRVRHILIQAAGALAEAHAAGLIHRDIKPANIMISRRGGVPDVVKVLDFGMVKEVDVVSELSESGVSYGTPLYLAPEAVKDPTTIDGRADLYALGLVGYYLLAGVRAVQGANLADVLHQHVSVVPAPPSVRLGAVVPAGLEALIMRCLAKAPADRPPSAEELARLLEELTDVPPWSMAEARGWWTRLKLERSTDPVEDRTLDVALGSR